MPTVIVDLDHTLLDTTRFKDALAEAVNLSSTEWDEAYRAYMHDNKLFDPDQFLKGVSADQRKAFDAVLHNTDRYLYKDSQRFLQQCLDADWKVIILTFGELAWQEQKVARCAFPAEIPVSYTDQPKVDIIEEFIDSTDRTIFVDDKAKEIDAIKRSYPQIEMYWIKRSNGAHHTPPQEDAILSEDLKFTI